MLCLGTKWAVLEEGEEAVEAATVVEVVDMAVAMVVVKVAERAVTAVEVRTVGVKTPATLVSSMLEEVMVDMAAVTGRTVQSEGMAVV